MYLRISLVDDLHYSCWLLQNAASGIVTRVDRHSSRHESSDSMPLVVTFHVNVVFSQEKIVTFVILAEQTDRLFQKLSSFFVCTLGAYVASWQ